MKEELEEGLENTHNLYYGMYRGRIASTDDPKNIGRVQLIVPQLYGEEVYEYWAFPKGMYAGKQTGFFFVPEKTDKVWVSFENGNPRFPIWEYGWWGEEDVPKGATPENKILQTVSGHKIEFNDKSEELTITNSSGMVIKMTKNGINIDALDKEINLYTDASTIGISKQGINIESDKKVNINGGFEVLYNKVSGLPITDVSQIGSSKKVTVG